MPAQKLSAKEAAAELGTDARTLRKFLRSKSSPIEPVGQGNRYEFTSKEVKALKKAYVSWAAGSKAKTESPKNADKDIEDDVNDNEEVDIDDDDVVDPEALEGLDDLEGPSDEDLEEIELVDLDD